MPFSHFQQLLAHCYVEVLVVIPLYVLKMFIRMSFEGTECHGYVIRAQTEFVCLKSSVNKNWQLVTTFVK